MQFFGAVSIWNDIGLAVRFWQLGIEMRPLISKSNLWAYPLFGGIGASFGWWLEGLGVRQKALLAERKKILLEKRARRDERSRVESKLENERFTE
ncbi:putative nadh-ubiquinone oxidoreductase 14 kda [Golovinomyces cichoracearum]|uniref:Putative nadh-ubiquinone oxidoreductase 14 kDa n=1 Tax=Golovinomyces cichoracearum TaxID=62708 RepID=A0A420HQ77_9PEZI|nr:putative nadh-ubiquinone oxidoreductase 14 kda [Golovinomyces cichoracearum]